MDGCYRSMYNIQKCVDKYRIWLSNKLQAGYFPALHLLSIKAGSPLILSFDLVPCHKIVYNLRRSQEINVFNSEYVCDELTLRFFHVL